MEERVLLLFEIWKGEVAFVMGNALVGDVNLVRATAIGNG